MTNMEYKKIFIDTNIILEYFMQREEFLVAEKLMEELHQQHCQMVMSAGGFYTIIFLFDKHIRKEGGLSGENRIKALRSLMRQILMAFTVAKQDNNSLSKGIEDMDYKDLEDACQYHLAEEMECQYMLTFNIDDFPKAPSSHSIPVLTPKQYLSLLEGKE